MTTNDTLVSAYQMAKRMLHRFIDDLTSAELELQPFPGANSAEWIVGHLALTVRSSAIRLGAEDTMGVSPGVVAQYSKTGQPAVEQVACGIAKNLLAMFDEFIDALIARLKLVPAKTLNGPLLIPSPFAKNFGEGVLFGAMHIMMHAGQLSTIRRILGKPPVV